MLITCKFHLSGYVVPRAIESNGMKLYPLGDVNNDVYLYATMFKGIALMNVRKVTNAQIFSKEGITFNSWEVAQFRKLRPELELAIADNKSGILDVNVGKYKLIRYHAESQLMELIKIDDHRKYEDANICLNADETRAFFGTFAQVYEEFHQLIASLPPTYPEPWKEHPPIPGVVLTTATSTVVISSTATSMQSEPRLPTGQTDRTKERLMRERRERLMRLKIDD